MTSLAIRTLPERSLSLAISRAGAALIEIQRHDGSWGTDTDLGPIGLATQILTERLFGATSPAGEVRAYFLERRLKDGSFPAYPGAIEGSVTVTALAWAALQSAGVPRADRLVAEAETFIDRHGGPAAIARAFTERGDVAALYLLAAGHLDAAFLPSLPPGILLAAHGRLIQRRIHSGNVMTMLVMAALAERHRARGPDGWLASTKRALEAMSIRRYLCRWQNDDGSWNGSPLQTTLMLLGLHATGMNTGDAEVKRALVWLESMKRHTHGLDVSAMDNDVWSTAVAAMALSAAGEPSDGPVLERAVAHLLSTQCQRAMPIENQRKPRARLTGGWPFQRGNESMPDTDDTGVVLAALGRIAAERAPRSVFRAMEDGAAWLRDMQNPDGGFPTFVWGLPSKRPGPMFMTDLAIDLEDPRRVLDSLLDPAPEYGDPSLEGVTGRALWGLGFLGVTRDDPDVCRAVDFLVAQQCDNGAWWGRWKACYLAETATILLGLAAVGEDPSAPYVMRALEWMLSCQNDDGGFGEEPDAYRDPQRAGRGRSMPAVTAYVLLGALAHGRAPEVALDRAADHLVESQRSDGLWNNEGWLHTFVPPDLLYEYPMPALALPLLALAEYARWSR